jgi:hypothetical protein
MASLPFTISMVIGAFVPMFSRRELALGKLLLEGAMLGPNKRIVKAALRLTGKSTDAHFQNRHRIFNRPLWSLLATSRILLDLLLDAFVPESHVLMGIAETIERRRGEPLSVKGLYKAPVRPSHTHFVKAYGLRMVCLMLAGTHALGRPGVGAAPSDRRRSLGRVLPEPRTPATIVPGSDPAGCATGTAIGPDQRASGSQG